MTFNERINVHAFLLMWKLGYFPQTISYSGGALL